MIVYGHFSPCVTSEAISTPSPWFMSLLNEFVVVCIHKYVNTVKLQDYQYHLHSHCKNHNVNVNSPSKFTLNDVLSQRTTAPATPVDPKAALAPCEATDAPWKRSISWSSTIQHKLFTWLNSRHLLHFTTSL